MTESRPSSLARIGEWIFRPGAMRAARAGLPSGNEVIERAANQARLLAEVARRVTEPVESLPPGSRPAVLCGLYRDAVYWALVAEQTGAGSVPPSDLAQAWAATPPERLAAAAGGEEALAECRSALLETSVGETLDVTPEKAARGRVLVDALLWDLDAPTRAVERVQVQRWTRSALALVVLVLAVFGIQNLLRGPNLAAARVFKTSSALPECTAPNKCAELLFHTQGQDNPWADFDLGAVKTVHHVEVTNRSDCCGERALPLIIEVSVDDKLWVQVARRDAEFTVWKADFPRQKARYVRLRIPRNSVLHLEDVLVR